MNPARDAPSSEVAEKAAVRGPVPVDSAVASPLGALADAGNGAMAALLSSVAGSSRDASAARPPDSPSLGADAVAALQLSGGNAAVARLLSGGGATGASTPPLAPETPQGPSATMPAAATDSAGLLAPMLSAAGSAPVPAASADGTAPELAAPGLAAPGLAAPGLAAPGLVAPAVSGPGLAAPSPSASGAAPAGLGLATSTPTASAAATAAPAVAAASSAGSAPATPAPATSAPAVAAPVSVAASASAPASGGRGAGVGASAVPVRAISLQPSGPAAVSVPTAVGDGAQEVVAAIAAAGTEGQAALAAAVAEQLATVAATVEAQQAGIEDGVAAQLAAVDSAFGDARGRLLAAIAGAQQQLIDAHQGEQQRLAGWSAETQQQLATGYATRAGEIQSSGVSAGGGVVSAAETIAAGTGSEVGGLAAQARAQGAARAASPGGEDADGAEARAVAAREVAGDTATQISGKLGNTVAELRGLGPETQAQLVGQANQIAMQIHLRLPTVAAVLGETTVGAGAQLSQAVAAGSSSLAAYGSELSTQLTGLQATVMRAIRQQADTAKESVYEAGRQTVEAGQAQHAQAAQAGAALLDGVLAGVANRKIRRAAAAKLSGELSAHVRQGFGDAEQQARVMLAEIAQAFSDTASQALDVLQDSAEQGRQQAAGVAGQGEEAAAGQAGALAAQLSAVAAAATGSGDRMVSGNLATLDQIVADLDTRFGQVLTEFRQSLTQRAGETTGQAREPVGTLDARMTTAMREAEEATHRSWLEKAWDSIPWGTIAGVIVGLVVTIAVVALLGTGIGALIVAGALSGALSAAATTLTDNAVHGRDTNWSDLGKQMLVGAAFGAVGGAIGGGVAGALGGAVERQLITEATAIAAGKAVNVATGATLGIVNNIAAGRPWHEGLLTNIGLSMALSYGPGGRFIEGVTQNARGAMVDSGAAFNVTAAETAASSARMQTRVGSEVEPPIVGAQEGAATPVAEEPVMDMPEGTVMYGDTPLAEAEARGMYQNARRDSPHNEVAVYRNSETGECIVVQGNNEYVDARASTNSAMREFIEGRPGEPGRWDLVEHSHPVDPATGVTLEPHRYPSGQGGDFEVARWQAEQSGKPVEQTIGIVTERGNETVTYGYDPADPQPYSLTYPGPDGAPVTQRFRSMEAYGEWYENQPGTGGGSPHIDAEATTAVAAAPGRETVAELKRRAFEAEARAGELRRGDWAKRAENLRETFEQLEGIASSPEEIQALAAQELAELAALEGEMPPRPPAPEPRPVKLTQEGGLAATEGMQILQADGTLSDPTHGLKKHGPTAPLKWLENLAETNPSGVAARFLDGTVMETVTAEAIAAAQPEIDAFLASNPPAGKNLVLARYEPGLGNLGEGYYKNPATGLVEPIPAGMPLTEVQVILKATGATPPDRAYVIQSTYPALP
ncbi:hypothetical protein GCM10010436_92360 [Paractinoplanes durhamensis]